MVINMPKKYYTRIVENELDQLLGIFGAVLIEGPKWCGKTTTAETRAASRLLLMDPSRNFENRLRAETRLARGGPEKEENHGPAPISSEPALPTQVSLL